MRLRAVVSDRPHSSLIATVSSHIPHCHHVVVHLFQLLLCGVEGVRRGVQLVGLESLIIEADLEGLVIFLDGMLGTARTLASNVVLYLWDIALLDVAAGGVGGDSPQCRGESGGIGSDGRSECAGCESREHSGGGDRAARVDAGRW